MLLRRGSGEARARWTGRAARGCGTRREARRRAPAPRPAGAQGRLTRAVARELEPGWVRLVRNPAQEPNPVAGRRAQCPKRSAGLQEGEDARVLGVLGLHPLHGGEVMRIGSSCSW